MRKVDLNGDGASDVLVGFSGEGDQQCNVLALDIYGQEMWRFTKDLDVPYSGPSTGKYSVSDIEILKGANPPLAAVLIKDLSWYPSALLLLDFSGQPRREL